MFMFNFNPTNKNELNYFFLCSSGNIYGVRFGVNSYGLNTSFFDERGEISKTPKEVLTASYLELRTTIFLTLTYSFILISETYFTTNKYV
jgi:hypothetical protein